MSTQVNGNYCKHSDKYDVVHIAYLFVNTCSFFTIKGYILIKKDVAVFLGGGFLLLSHYSYPKIKENNILYQHFLGLTHLSVGEDGVTALNVNFKNPTFKM